MNKRIHIIDDEEDMIKIATDLLQSEGFTVVASTHPKDGLKKLRNSPPDLLILDIRLPDMDGIQVIREMKADPKLKSIPVIMVSVKSDESDVVLGLELGAEDYMAKPFRKRELLARVRLVLRRYSTEPEAPRMTVGSFSIDYRSYTFSVNSKTITLTPREFELIGYLLSMDNRIVTRASISEAVWGTEFTGSSRTIDVHVDQIRRKLGNYGECIKSLKGIGYRFESGAVSTGKGK